MRKTGQPDPQVERAVRDTFANADLWAQPITPTDEDIRAWRSLHRGEASPWRRIIIGALCALLLVEGLYALAPHMVRVAATEEGAR